MKPLSLQNLATYCGGHLTSGDPDRQVTRLSTDSRRIEGGEAFLALVGDRFDGHAFTAEVARQGAAVLIVSRPLDAMPSETAVIQVPDTLKALQNLAREYRRWHNPRVVALSGSNGKTSTKDLLKAALSPLFQVCATAGNLNNHIGLPLTLLSAGEGEDCIVAEMGMNHAGELKVLTDIAEPDAAVLTNVGRAHIEHLGSRDRIAWEKATVACQVASTGAVTLNANDEYSPLIARLCRAEVTMAGIEKGDVCATGLRPGIDGTTFHLDFSGERHEARISIPGQHMVTNAALAACTAWRHGVPIPAILESLASATLTGGRLQPRECDGILFLDDSYNANPDSMKAGLETLKSTPAQRRFAVLGAMGELGEFSREGHEEVARIADGLGLDGLFAVGGQDADHYLHTLDAADSTMERAAFPDHSSCATHLKSLLQAGDAVLLKGSRAAAMEQVFSSFQTA